MKTNLKQLRKSAGWTNADEFARSIGMPPKTYRNYEQGVRSLGLDVASEICNALGCSINDLVIQDDPRTEYYFMKLDVDKTESENVDKAESEEDDSDDERELLELYRSLPEKGKHAVLAGLRDYAT